ncbi:MAG: AAA family ATPase, partial [Sedimentisphaerales bacterium]|nr:AAA family ATPase [Sedimentisphaerales bacterium]
IEQSIYDVLVSHRRGEPIKLTEILWEIGDNFELAPSSIDLAAFDQQTSGIAEREDCLKDVLATVEAEYDYVIVDCPPAVGLLTFNAMRAATDVIVPVETGYFSLHGLSKQLDTLSILCKQCSQHIHVMVLASMYDIRTKMAREILADLRKHFSGKMFKTVVNFNTKLKEAASLGQPIGEYEPASRGYQDFKYLAQELIATDTRIEQKQLVESLRKEEPKIPIVVEKEPTRKEVVRTFDNQLESISSSAQELLANVSDIKETTEKAVQDIDTRLNDFYGVRQFGSAVKFVTLYPRAKSVQIAGDFNNWQPQKTELTATEDGKWELALSLAPGKYRYRMVVDGQWQQDPYNEQVEMNPFGEYNSVLEVV